MQEVEEQFNNSDEEEETVYRNDLNDGASNVSEHDKDGVLKEPFELTEFEKVIRFDKLNHFKSEAAPTIDE